MTETDEVNELAHRLINIKSGEEIIFWKGPTFPKDKQLIIDAAAQAYKYGAAKLARRGDTFIAHGRAEPYFPTEDDPLPPLPEPST